MSDFAFIQPRSVLFMPADQLKLAAKAAASEADAVCLDLEDSVAATHKKLARANLAEAAQTVAATGKGVYVRVNNESKSGSDYAQDLANLPRECSAVVLPKLQSAQQLAAICAKLDSLAKVQQCDTQCIVMLEDPAALLQLSSSHSAPQRLTALTLGTEDLAHALQCAPNSPLIAHAFYQLALIAGSMGVALWGFPASIGEYRNLGSYAKNVQLGRDAGATAAFAIHPDQLAVLNQIFTPSRAEQNWAEAVKEAFDAAQQEGKAVADVDGQMIDLPVYLRAKAILAKASMATWF